jgi:Uma2 family endonuclease
MSSLAKPSCTPQEYLALERKADYRSEYVNGQIFAMSGASREHNLITTNVTSGLHTQLRGRRCEVYSSDMRVKVHPTGLYTYPDVVVVCGEPAFEDGQLDTLTNPTVIVEVLSPSTEAYDRGDKFAYYRRLESLTDYVLVSQDKVRVEHYVRHPLAGDSTGQGKAGNAHGLWVLSELDELDGPNDTLGLASIGCSLRLSDIYERVEFTDNTDVISASSGPG